MAQLLKYKEVEFTCQKAKELCQRDPYDWQIETWNYINEGRDVIVLAAPGSGKNLIFQMTPFLRRHGKTLIVSLMNNQVYSHPYLD
jgi:superfamily II DNA/RNA helicase